MLTSAKKKREKLGEIVIVKPLSNENASHRLAARIVKQNTQTSQKDFMLVTHSKSVDCRTIIQVIEYRYQENAFKIIFKQLND